jgi:hypothetical protein
LRDLARGIFPPALADRGVVAALEGHLLSAFPSARLELDGLARDQRFTPDVETAVYFCSSKRCRTAPSTLRERASACPWPPVTMAC